jgi:two-component system sensor histidine kinase CpxA
MRPRTIFGAIIVWLLAAVVLSVLGFVATSLLLSARWGRPNGFMHRFQRFEIDEARASYEEGGPPRLAAYLRRLDAALGARHLVVGPDHRSLVDGRDCSSMLHRDKASTSWFFFRRPHPSPLIIPSVDGRYRMIIDANPPPFGPWDFLLNFLWLPILIAVLCYLLAVHFANPLRKLTRAVERFGLGEMSARVGEEAFRRDEIGDLARAFNAMAERTQTLLTAERRLLQDVSHELKTPLTRLGFGVELARTSPDREAALARVKKDLIRLGNLVDELLQLTRSEGDPSGRILSDVDLDDLAEELIEDCSVEAQARGCRLKLQRELRAHPVVRGEPELLRRALENVIRNAIRHTGEGTDVNMTLKCQDGHVTIEVRDHGPGVPESDLERIFRPFYRVESHRDRASGGVGLGLAIVRRALALHGGQITARNTDPGLSVRLEIPVGR